MNTYPERSITIGLSVCGSADRLHLNLSRGLNAISLNPEQASELCAYINTWLYEYWQRDHSVVVVEGDAR